MEKPFVINHRFLLDPALHLLNDLDNKTQTRMERRHVKLLCMLGANEGSLLERELVVNEIWNNYGGADEALTQAISILRKLLDDHQKTLIETIPRRGYVMHATISDPAEVINQNETKDSARKPSFWLVGTLTAIIIVLVLFILLPTERPQEAAKDKHFDKKEMSVTNVEEQQNSKNSSPPPGGKDDAR